MQVCEYVCCMNSLLHKPQREREGKADPIEARGYNLSASILIEDSLDWAEWIPVTRVSELNQTEQATSTTACSMGLGHILV